MPGVVQIIGESRSFKTNFALLCVKAYLDHDPEAVCVFIDTEKGASKYFKPFGIDENRVVYNFCENLEEMKFITTKMIKEIKLGEKVIFFIDSVSQVPSIKEVENAVNDHSAADMTRAREMNSFFRIITPMINNRNLSLIAINSFYESIVNQYAEPTIKGGKQSFLSSDIIFFVTRSQDKVDGELKGYNFNYNIMKSRYVREKSKFQLHVTWDGGIDKWSGLLDIARSGGFVDMPTSGWYTRTNICGFNDDKKYRKSEMNCEEFWLPILKSNNFKEYVKKTYMLETGQMIQEPEIDLETGEII